ncbi:MAG: hypothetical protein QOF08_1593 [Gaiellales bacterium]|jgi:hypothetical protein|nr:hypothetical protein [Gaiellales bacterium]
MIVAVMLTLLTGCGQAGGDSAARGRLAVVVAAAPTCPVEQLSEPCDPRPVNAASLLVERPNGDRVLELTVHAGRADSGSAGLAAGRYQLVAQKANGVLGTPAPVAFTIHAGGVTRLTLTYDTGIR